MYRYIKTNDIQIYFRNRVSTLTIVLDLILNKTD